MKKFKTILKIVTLLICLLNYSCKYDILEDNNLEGVNAGENLKNLTIWQYLSSDQSNTMTSISTYFKAAKLAGLEDLLNSDENLTVIIPTDKAFADYLVILGYSKLEDVPVPVLKNALLGNVKKGKTLSTDLKLGETGSYSALNGDSLYLTRSSGDYDEYVFTINKNSKLSSPSVVTRSQNLSFKNGAAHVVDAFPYYSISSPIADAVDPNLPLETINFNVTKDVYVRPGTYSSINYNDGNEILVKGGTRLETQRLGLLQYPLSQPSFGVRIGAAKLNLYITTFDTGASNPLSIYTTEEKDWVESSVTFANAPKYNNVPFATASIPLASLPNYVSIDITDEIAKALKENKPYINLGIVTGIESGLKFKPKEYQSGKFKSYITVSSSPQTLLSILKQTDVTVDRLIGFKIITKDNLSMKGTTDKNIFFKISKLPENGFLMKSGIVLKINDNFTQADINNGVVKYLYSGTGIEDRIELEARDFEGGYYNDLLYLKMTIN